MATHKHNDSHDPTDFELEKIFGPAPVGGDIVVAPDNPILGPQFSAAETDAIADHAVTFITQGTWEDEYGQIRHLAGLEPDTHPTLFDI
jgi:hypothetical protein